MKVITPFGVSDSWTEAHEVLKKNNVAASDETFKPVQIEISLTDTGGRDAGNKTPLEVMNELNKILKEHYKEEYDLLDSRFSAPVIEGKIPIPQYHWIAVYAVRGSAEGHYIHVDVIKADNSRETMLLAKTFAGLAAAYDVAKICAELLSV